MPIPDEPRPELVRVLLRPLRTEERVQIEVKAGTTVRALRLVIEQKFGVSPATKILKFTKQRTYVVCPAGERINRHRIFHLKDVEWLTDPSAPLREIVSRIPSAFTTEMPYEAAKQEVDAEHPRQRFRVVVTHMWVRAEPTLEARRLGTLALNDIISGHEANGWLRLDAASSTTADVEPGLVAWALIDGRPFGYALLLERLDADRSGNEMGTLLHGNGAVPTLKERALRHDGAVHRADSLDSSTGADGSLPSEVDELGLPQVEAEDSGLEQQRVAQSENDQLQDDQEASNLAALGPEIWAVMQDLRGIDAARTKALELLELLQEATGASRRQESSTDLVYEGESPQCTDQSMEMSPEHWPSESRLGSEACEERCVWTPQVTTPQFKDPLLLRQVFPGGVRYGEWYNASEKTRLRAPLTMLRGSLAPDLQAYLLDRAPFNAASYGAHVALRQRYGLARDRQKVTDPADFVKADWHTIAGWPEGAFELWVECMRAFKRLDIGANEWGQELLDLLLFNFDSVCVVAYAQAKGSEVSDEDFWSGHKNICSLVVKVEDVEQLLGQPLANLPPEAAVVSRVTASSSLGQKMFGRALPVVLGLQLENALQEDLEGLSSPVTQAKLDGVMQRSYEKMDELNAEDPLNVQRTIEVDYRGLKVKREASSWAEQLLVTIMAWLENKGIQSKLIKELSFEVGLFPAPDGGDFKIDAEVHAGFVQARKAFEGMLAGNKLDGAVSVDLLVQKQKAIKGFDKTWPTKVDAFSQLHGLAGKAKLEQGILQVLPADGDYKSLDDVLGSLAALRGQQLFKFGCKDTKDMLDSVVDVYKSVKAGSFSAADCKGSTLMQQVCAAIPWSYRFKDKHQGKERLTHGPAGLELVVEHLSKVHAAGNLTMEQLSNVNIFSRWVPDKVRKEVEAMTTAVLGGYKTASKRKAAPSAASSSKGSAGSSTKSKKSAKADNDQAEFDGIFAELFG